jgi:type IV pilus assembly protein PilF
MNPFSSFISHGFNLRLISALILVVQLTACATGGVSDVTPQSLTERISAAENQVNLGVGYMQNGHTELALERFERALRFNPKCASAHTSMGVLYEQISQPDLAEKNYRLATELEPKKGDVRNNFGQFLCRIGRYDEADLQFKFALADPFYKTPSRAASNAGKCARAAGHLDAAEQYLRVALKQNPDTKEAFLPLAGLLFARGQSMNARAFLQRYEASGLAQDAEFLKLAAQVEEKLGDAKAAAAYRDRLSNEFPAPENARSTEKTPDSSQHFDQPKTTERAQ